MIQPKNGMCGALRWTVGALLAMGLSLSSVAQAAGASATGTKTKKPVAAKVAESKKKSTAKVLAKAPKKAVVAAAPKAAAKKTVVARQRDAKKSVAQKKASSARAVKLAKGAKVQRLARTDNRNKAALRTASTKGHSNTRHEMAAVSVVRMPLEPRISTAERLGLRASHDALDLSSSVALVVDQETSEVLFSKNDTAVLPIASLTKLMTGLVIADANLPLDEQITISEEDAAVYRNSRLAVGTTLSRSELMHLSLMSSENRAANALGRTFPGGM